MSEAVVVGRLRIRSGRGIDPLLLRLRAAHLLEAADLTPSGLPPGAIGHYRLRPPVKPLTLAELATMPDSQAARDAVLR